ncbi:hypothetical protein DV515_00012005 [Chloebia gouldiae]|uniref:Uncharacterized protein n=1 Tax=Chloebia gouldiae TaxID=44316 RepID=A0A3L8S538_CHLGU|nr:hypothetical protein DV515_00012005 [Chloebia gouldiae]
MARAALGQSSTWGAETGEALECHGVLTMQVLGGDGRVSDLPVLALKDDEDGFPGKLQQPPEPFPVRQMGDRMDILVIQEELVAMAVFQLRLHNEVDELSVIGGSGVGDLSVAVPVPEEHIQAALDIEHSQKHQKQQDQEGCQHRWHVPHRFCQDREGHASALGRALPLPQSPGARPMGRAGCASLPLLHLHLNLRGKNSTTPASGEGNIVEKRGGGQQHIQQLKSRSVPDGTCGTMSWGSSGTPGTARLGKGLESVFSFSLVSGGYTSVEYSVVLGREERGEKRLQCRQILKPDNPLAPSRASPTSVHYGDYCVFQSEFYS